MKEEIEKSVMEEKERVRQEIIQAAQEVFQLYGWKKTCVEDIAKRVGKGKSTLYHYFKNKEEIFFSVLMKELCDVCEKMEDSVKEAESFEEKLRAFFHIELRKIFGTTNLYASIRDYWVNKFMNIEAQVACNHRNRDMVLLMEIIEKGFREGLLEKMTGDKRVEIAETLLQARMGFIIEQARAVKEEEFECIERRLNTFLDLIVYGLLKR